MRPTTNLDTNSPWYESFSPKALPILWSAPTEAEQVASPPPPPLLVESDEATEAIFHCYNA
jgi:hypothetical protein